MFIKNQNNHFGGVMIRNMFPNYLKEKDQKPSKISWFYFLNQTMRSLRWNKDSPKPGVRRPASNKLPMIG